MQRNVIYSRQVLNFILSALVLIVLTGCGADGWQSGAPPEPTLPGASAPSSYPSTTTVPGYPGLTPMPGEVQNNLGAKNKVALLLPMTGRGSDAGQAMLNAAQLAMFDLGAGAFELIPGDTGAPGGAAQAANEAIQNKAGLILGPLFANDTKMIAPTALQAGLNVISFSTDTSAAGPNTFVLGFLPQSQVRRVMEYANFRGLSRIALIAPRDQYGDTVSQSFDQTIRLRGLTSAGVLRYSGAQPNADEIRQFVSGKSFDAVLIAANGAQASSIAQYLPANIQKLGTGLWDQADVTGLPGLQGAWYAASSPRLRQKFETRYRDTYGEAPTRLASLAYDAAALAVVLSKQGQGFGRQALLNPNGFSGIDGIFRFLPDGLNDRGLAILEIRTGGATIIQEAPTNFRTN